MNIKIRKVLRLQELPLQNIPQINDERFIKIENTLKEYSR